MQIYVKINVYTVNLKKKRQRLITMCINNEKKKMITKLA